MRVSRQCTGEKPARGELVANALHARIAHVTCHDNTPRYLEEASNHTLDVGHELTLFIQIAAACVFLTCQSRSNPNHWGWLN